MIRMRWYSLVFFFLVTALGWFCSGSEVGTYYTVASVSHDALSGGGDPSAIINASLAMYESDVAMASQQYRAQMILFPEFGLGGDFLDRDTMFPFCGLIPPLGSNPCLNSSSSSSVAYQASCMAMKYKIIVVLNTCQVIPCIPGTATHLPPNNKHTTNSNNETCPRDGRFQYNTEIVLDETGTLIAVYHKSHPFYINCFDTPHPYDVVTFNTSFGVEFGIFICFDIAFDTPAEPLHAKGIRSIAYSSSIGNTTASFAFHTWSSVYQSSLLVSNLGHEVGGVFTNGTQVSFSSVAEVGNGDVLSITQVPL